MQIQEFYSLVILFVLFYEENQDSNLFSYIVIIIVGKTVSSE
jgi:hypothetical protein